MKERILITLSLVLCSFATVSQTGYSLKYQLKYFDTAGSQLDYRGVRSFRNEISSSHIDQYMQSNRDYYIAYFDRNSFMLKYQFLNNGNIIYEDYYYYKHKKLKIIRTMINSKPVYTTYLDNNPYQTKRVNHNNKTYIKNYFNKSKKLEKVVQYDQANRVITSTKISYTRKGLQEILKYYGANQKLIAYKKFYYQDGVKLKTANFRPNDKLIEYTKFFYDAQNQLAEIKTFNKDGYLIERSEYEYQDGKLIYVLDYDSKGRLLTK